MEEYHMRLDIWILLDRWLREYPPGDPRHDEAERDIATAEYYLDQAEINLQKEVL